MQQKTTESKKAAFIVKDAKTYINAEEAWYKFTGKKKGSILFIVIPVKDPNSTVPTFKEVIDAEKWEDVVWFYSLSNYSPREYKRIVKRWKILGWLNNGKEYILNFIDRVRLDRLAKRYRPVEIVFSGHRNTQEHLAAALKPSELFIMDSGMGITNKINNKGYIDYRSYLRRHRFKYLMHILSGMRVFDRSKTKFFTIYKDSVNTKHEITENEYAYRKMLVKKKKIGKLTFYISSPLYRRQNISLNQYIRYLKELFEHYKLNASEVVYIPHPVHENGESINKIINELGCKLDERDIPVETKITLYDTLPDKCISPYSSSLINISVFSENRFPLIFAWHNEFDCFETLNNWKRDTLEKNPNIRLDALNNFTSLFGFGQSGCDQPEFKDFEAWDAAVYSKSFVRDPNTAYL